MVRHSKTPNYDLNDAKTACQELNIEFRGRKVRLDILNLDYQLTDVALCLSKLTISDFRKTNYYSNRPPDDEYICNFTKPGNEHLQPDRLYIKFCLPESHLMVDLASFHLTRF